MSYKKNIKLAESYLEKGSRDSYERAIEYASKALTHERTGYALLVRGISQVKLSDFSNNSSEIQLNLAKEGLDTILLATVESPDHIDILEKAGRFLFEREKYSEANSVLKKCLMVEPKNVEFKILLGRSYFENGQYEEAKDVFESIDLYTEALGGTFVNQLIQNLRKNISPTPIINKTLLWNFLAETYVELKLYEDAIRIYIKLLKSNYNELRERAIGSIIDCYEKSDNKNRINSIMLGMYEYVEKNKNLKEKALKQPFYSKYNELEALIDKLKT